jgi:hypothetical protein
MKQKTPSTSSPVRPMMEVYAKDWKWLGLVEDRGTGQSLTLARERFGPLAYFVLPTLVEAL